MAKLPNLLGSIKSFFDEDEMNKLLTPQGSRTTTPSPTQSQPPAMTPSRISKAISFSPTAQPSAFPRLDVQGQPVSFNPIKRFFSPIPDEVRIRDVIREMPGVTADFLVDVARSIPRLGVRTGTSLKYPGVPLEITPQPGIQQTILGKEPIATFPLQKKKVEELGVKLGVPEPAAKLLSTPVVVIGALMDLPGDPFDFVQAGGKKMIINNMDELVTVLKSEFKIKPQDLDDISEEVIKLTKNQITKLNKKYNLVDDVAKLLRKTEPVINENYILQKQGDNLLVRIGDSFKDQLPKVEGAIKKAAKEITEKIKKIDFIDNKVFSESVDNAIPGPVKQLDEIKFPEYWKPEEIDRAQVEAIKRSLLSGDKINPLVLDEADNVLDGAHRLQAMKEMDYRGPIETIIQKVPKKEEIAEKVLTALPSGTPVEMIEAGRINTIKAVKKYFKETKEVPDDFVNLLKTGEKPIQLTSIADELSRTTKKGLTFPEGLPDSVKTWKDKASPIQFERETTIRNIEDVAGPHADKVKEFFTDRIVANETARVRLSNEIRTEFTDKIVKGMGIRKGSEADKLIMRYGEGRISLDELKTAVPDQWEQIVEASTMFRNQYDALLDMANTARAKYGYDPIAKRDDYFIHYQEIGNFIEQVGMMDKQKLPTEIAGLTEMFKPGKPFSTTELQRKGAEFTESAIGGMDKYLNSMTRQIFHIDSVQRGRALDNMVREQIGEGKQLANFATWLRGRVDLMAGKQHAIDRVVTEKLMGRWALNLMDTLGRKVGANLTGGNISTAITNFIPFTQTIATTDKDSFLRGLVDATTGTIDNNPAMIDGIESSFLTRRFPNRFIDISKLSEKVADKASFMFEAIDKFVGRSIVAGKYREAIKKGFDPKAAMKSADEYAARVMADRSFAQSPSLFESKAIRPLAQFQLEVNNHLGFVFKDIPKNIATTKAEAASMVTQVFIATYLFNNIFEKVAGRRPGLDPIHAATQLFRGDRSGLENVWFASKEIAEQLPFTGMFSGGRIPLTGVLPSGRDIKDIVTAETPEEAGIAALNAILETGVALGLPTGGGQLKKIFKGGRAVIEGGVYDREGNLKFPISDRLDDKLRAITFGPYSDQPAQLYFDQSLRALSKNQTAQWKVAVDQGVDPVGAWVQLQMIRLNSSYPNAIEKMVKTTPDIEDRQKKAEDIQREYRFRMEELLKIIDVEGVETGEQPVDSDVLPPAPPPVGSINLDDLQLPTNGITGRPGVKFSIKAPPKISSPKIDVPIAIATQRSKLGQQIVDPLAPLPTIR